MKPFTSTAAAFVVCMAAVGAGWAATGTTAPEAKAMSEKALAHVKAVGVKKAFADFGDKGNAAWHDRDLYVFVMGFDGVMAAHGTNQALVGKNLGGMKDATGKEIDMERVARKGPGWIDYLWSNPETKKMQPKTTYLAPIPKDLFDGYIGVGAYK